MFVFQAEDGIRDLVRSRGLGDVYKRQVLSNVTEDEVYARRKELGINRVYKTVDTCAAEFLSLIHI